MKSSNIFKFQCVDMYFTLSIFKLNILFFLWTMVATTHPLILMFFVILNILLKHFIAFQKYINLHIQVFIEYYGFRILFENVRSLNEYVDLFQGNYCLFVQWGNNSAGNGTSW